LNALKPLSAGQTQRIEALGDRVEVHNAGAMLYQDDGGQIRPSLLLSGWACRQRLLPDGRRQIFSLMLPGDGIGFCPDASPLASASVVALTKVAVASLEPPLGAAPPPTQADSANDVLDFSEHMRLSAFLDEGLLLDHVVRLGRQTAYERTAHLILELHWRSGLIGQADDRSFTLPLTQEILADVLGLSVVHINRTLQNLRRERLVDMTGQRVVLLDAAQLSAIADFQPPVITPAT
jgi:CRP-like cAMP-binding protein